MKLNDRKTAPGVNRREFIKYTGVAGGTMLMGLPGGLAMSSAKKSNDG